ncbi:MAG: hypothetical protein AAFY25_08715 [Pseudomonadota bacterium]
MNQRPKTGWGQTYLFPTSLAREKISQIIHLTQDPRATVILTRHGRQVAAVVSMTELDRIRKQQDVEDVSEHGVRSHKFYFGPSELGAKTLAEAGEKVQEVQLNRLMEREVLRKAGLPVVKGGELAEVVEVKERARRWWWFRRR